MKIALNVLSLGLALLFSGSVLADASLPERFQGAYNQQLANCNYISIEEFMALMAKADEAAANCDWISGT